MPFDLTGLTLALSRRQRDARRRRLAKERANEIVGTLCALTRHALEAGRINTPLNHEGLYRRVVRSALCRQGWGWQPADDAARGVTEIVFNILQAKRPTWNEGQREWTIREGLLIERTRCMQCHKPLPEGNFKYCGKLCQDVAGQRRLAMQKGSEADVLRICIKVI